MRAIGYARLSKANEKSVSIEYQVEAIETLAHSEGYELVGIELDYGISGKYLANRPGVQRVLSAVQDHKVDSVLVYRSDRLARNGIEGLKTRKMFADNKVRYLSSTEGELKLDVLGYVQEGMAEGERIKISERTKIAIDKKKAKGERVGCQLPYGQAVVKSQVVTVDSEVAVINRVTHLRSTGLSLRNIATQINIEGYRTRKGTAFSLTQVVRILKAA